MTNKIQNYRVTASKWAGTNRLNTCISTALTALCLVAPGVQAQEQNEERSGVLEEVTVTAMRRGEQNLMDVPIAITAFGGSWMEDRGFSNLGEFIQLAPGASILEFTPGYNNIQMRGVSAGVGENNVGYYLDEVPFAYINQTAVVDVRSFDLERVEILRGPQGTLYGAGAIAGVVRTITRDPVLDRAEFRGDVSASSTKGGGENYEGNFALNMPIVEDRLAVRAVYMQEEQSGWIDQTVFGAKNYNDSDVKNFRVKLLGQVTDELTVTAMAWGSRIKPNGTPSAFDDGTNDDGAPTPSSFGYDIYNLKVRYDGDKIGLVSSTSKMTADTELVIDFAFGFTLESLLNPETITQEVRLFSTYDSPWQWTAGAYYRDADQTQIQDSLALALFGIDPVKQYDKVKAWNVFAEVTGTFLDGKLDLTAGARYLNETRSSENIVRPSVPFENDFNAVTPRFNVTYRPQDNWMTYFNYGEGFRSGINQFALSLETANALGVILPSAADPETVESYELGLKGQFFDDRLTVDVAAFMIKWKDLQTIVPVIAGALSGVVNASKAESPGVEVSLNWLAAEGLTVGLIGSWNDSHIVGDVFADATLLDPVTGLPTGMTVPLLVFADGDRLNNVPEWTAGATLSYFHPLTGEIDLVANGSLQYASKREARSRGTAEFGENLLTVNARVGVDLGHWGVYLFGENLGNEDGVISPDLVPGPNYGYRYRPRTIGINVKFDY